MQRFVASGMIVVLTTTSVFSQPAFTTANVNFRSGPGTSYGTIGTIPEGAEVDLSDCDESGSWCAVEFEGQTGFSSGKYLQLAEAEDDLGWPRAFDLSDGSFIVLHEPQYSEWDSVENLEALIAAEYYRSAEAEPVFGVIGLAVKLRRTDDPDAVAMSDPTISRVDFGTLGREAVSALSVDVGDLLPTGEILVPTERVAAKLADIDEQTDVDGLTFDAPTVFISDGPSRLLMTDGEPVFAPVGGTSTAEFVVNTNWDLFRTDGTLYLRDETHWLTAAEITGPWEATQELPEALSALPDDGSWDDAKAAVPGTPYDDATPEVFYADAPAELINSDGPPVYEDVPGGDLEWMSNSESDVFRLKSSGVYYYLVSGRWFSAPSLDGPWTFATEDLPADFLAIPDDVPYYSVRASVPDTSEAKEARLRASIPEVVEVSRDMIEMPTVVYDGEPVFEPIEETDLKLAANTESQVIQVGAAYFLILDGIWFTSSSPEGPWEIAESVPEAIYEIPPSSSAYNTTYVRIYESSPMRVYYRYHPGYWWSFLAWGVLVYGTGWRYRPYYRYSRYPVYYPRPITFGSRAYYNPARGAYGRYGYGYGPYRGLAATSVFNPTNGNYARGARAWGDNGQRGFIAAGSPANKAGVVARGGNGAYGSWGSAVIRKGPEVGKISGGSTDKGRGVKWDSTKGTGFAVSGRRGNVLAGNDGSVYRKSGDEWQKWDGDGWGGVAPPERSEIRGSDRASALQDRAGGASALQDRAGGAAAAGAAAGVAAGAIQNRPAGSRPNQPAAGTNRPAAGADRPATGANRPATGNTPTRKPSNLPQVNRPSTQPAAKAPARTQQSRPQTKQRAPSNVQRDSQARQKANQRSMQKSAPRKASPQRSRPSGSRPSGGGRGGGLRR
ncbi:SH3 domain-containing protein [Tropicimonas sp. TH_r6]|uniref:SH3 domain-containing protein n=1 Tax=Tropicimonas sp. TH_r6 TaxID=3082085 RepID=UPI002953600A|nr:SH3 domain-containing protein [Tropicimonas sp. TH_r6]MDV7143433.1 SH3 domain-containing protein [Tropicimonas sp. TH_r6]